MEANDLADLRREYRYMPLRRADLDPDPLRQFDLWFRQALEVEAMDANAMTLATATADGQPSVRTVLLKYYDESGFVFYTNLGSRKADEIAGNPNVALLFYWHELHRQVKITGTAERTTAAENIKYFRRRPRDSQIGAWVSQQSRALSSRAVLEQKFAEIMAKFAKGEVPLPSFWGGYRVQPESIEFWQGREKRLHDRFRFARGDHGWELERLAP
ncbi:MAG: pyridoxamine 5'-phosphate oxidase [Planctomycetota bacterium]|jgi:pyridoxamine 5'-phosphate oxidase